MAEIVQIGKRWRVKRADGSYLLNNHTGKIAYFNKQAMAQFRADMLTKREQEGPRPPSWRQAVIEARAKVYAEIQEEN
jgi:hypothetical protein